MTTKYDASEEFPDGDWAEERDFSEITLKDFEDLCRQCKMQDDVVDKIEEELKIQKKEQSRLYDQIQKILVSHEKDKHTVSGIGTWYRNKRWSWKIPQDLESKKKFFNYLREKGIFMELASVNSMTLNSFCKAELESAKERGEADWTVPGLDQPTVIEKVNFRKSTK